MKVDSSGTYFREAQKNITLVESEIAYEQADDFYQQENYDIAPEYFIRFLLKVQNIN